MTPNKLHSHSIVWLVDLREHLVQLVLYKMKKLRQRGVVTHSRFQFCLRPSWQWNASAHDTTRSSVHPKSSTFSFCHNSLYSVVLRQSIHWKLLSDRWLLSLLSKTDHRLKRQHLTFPRHYSFLSAWKVNLGENHVFYLDRALPLQHNIQ